MRNTASILLILASLIALAVSYSTSGNRILDPSGNPILLRGVARPSLEWNKAGEQLSLNDYQQMKNWGANVVRIGLNQGYWLSDHIEYDPNYITTVAQQVTWIKSLGMGVILDLHWSNKGIKSGYCGQQVHADQNSLTFWTAVATKYKNDAWVIFELYNEPHDVSYDVWRNGGALSGWTGNAPGFQKLYDNVRATGANNVVIINGLDYAFDLKMLPQYAITGSNIVYGTHPYDFSTKLAGSWPGAFGFLASTYPLIATEFGSLNCDASYNQQFVDYANTNAISWTAWGWYPGGCSFPALIDNWQYTVATAAVPVKTSLGKDSKIPSGGTSTTKAATTAATTAAATTTTTTTTTGTTTGGTTTATDVFTDSLQNSFADYSWNSKLSIVSTPYQSGSKSVQFVANSYNAAYFYRAAFIDTTKHKAIEFYVHGGTAGGQAINFNLVKLPSGGSSVKYGPDQRVATYTTTGTLPANAWVKATVTLSNFPAGIYDGFWFIDQSGTTLAAIYIDSIRVLNK